MKRALSYSLLFHLIIFLTLVVLQKGKEPEKAYREPLSVSILPPPVEKPLLSPKESIRDKIERTPPIKTHREPRKIDSIPKVERQDSVKKEPTKEEAPEKKPSIESEDRFAKFSTIERNKRGPNIFDREVIGEIAKRENKGGAKVESSKGLSFSTREFDDWGYLQRLKEKIERVWQYPPQAAERGIYGDLYIKFTIDKNGKLTSVELLRTSGYRLLDDAALRAIKEAEPFWPLPKDYEKESLTITGHFIYILRGFYLR